MEKKQLLQNNNGFVGFYPNTNVPCFDITINIGDDEITDNYLFTQTINLDDTFIDTFNKVNEKDYALLRLNITGNKITAANVPMFIGYRGSKTLYFRESIISNPDKDYEQIYIRNINIESIDIEAKTAILQFVHRRLAKNEFTGDGTKFLSDNGTYKAIEAGDKTNVLILSLEDDLANGQKNSPVNAEISAALKDAISTGKACVIKSANSDILANLQQIGNNVTIVMEQISRVGQTFVAVNTTITVNTTTNVISDYQTGAIVLETEGDRNKFLSNDGTYKYPYAAGIFFSKDNRQATNRNYWGNYIIEKQDNNGHCTLVLISDCTQVFDETSTIDIATRTVFGIGGYGILNRITSDVYPYSKPIFIEAIIGIDKEHNRKNQLYTNNWRILPCIVKYQNKYYIAIRFGNINTIEPITMGSCLNIIGQSSNLLDSYIYLNCEEGQLYPTEVEVIQEGTYFDKNNLKYDKDNLLAKTDEDGYMSKEDKTKLDNTPTQKILTESEYAALGTTPNNDNILYFITPD